MPQDHKAFPNITRLTLDMIGYNGGLHVLRAPEIGAEAEVKRLLDECIGAEGVYYDDLSVLDAWLGTLNDKEFMIVADGEEKEIEVILSRAPSMNSPEDTVSGFIDSIYDHCIISPHE